MNLGSFEKMVKYVIDNKDVLQISLTITEIGKDDYHFSIDTVSNAQPKQKIITGNGYTIEEAMAEWSIKSV